MTPEQINKAAKEYARNHSSAPDKETPDWIINDFTAGANLALSHSRQEIEDLKAVIKKQEKEYILNGSVQEWKDYAERTTSIIKNLKDGKTKAEAENEKLREALGDLYHFVERMKISQVAGHAYRNAARKLIEG